MDAHNRDFHCNPNKNIRMTNRTSKVNLTTDNGVGSWLKILMIIQEEQSLASSTQKAFSFIQKFCITITHYYKFSHLPLYNINTPVSYDYWNITMRLMDGEQSVWVLKRTTHDAECFDCFSMDSEVKEMRCVCSGINILTPLKFLFNSHRCVSLASYLMALSLSRVYSVGSSSC
jgi:hypothetical protein